MKLLEGKQVKVPMDEDCVFPLERVGQAHAQAINNPHKKVVLQTQF